MSVWKIVGIVVFAFVIIGALMIALWGFGVLTADIKGQGDVRIETKSAPFRMEAYNYFHDKYGAILALEKQIDESIAQLAVLEPGTKTYDRVLTNVTALKSLRHQAIQEYNANARKDYTVGQFRDVNLPFQIEDTDYPGGVR